MAVKRSQTRWQALIAAFIIAFGIVCVDAEEPVISFRGSRATSSNLGSARYISFRRQLTDIAPLTAEDDYADAPDSVESASAPTTDAGTNGAAAAGHREDLTADQEDEEREFLDWVDFNNRWTILAIVLACLGAILCSGLGCMCCAVCCGKPKKKTPAPDHPKEAAELQKPPAHSKPVGPAEKAPLAPIKTQLAAATATKTGAASASVAAFDTFDTLDDAKTEPMLPKNPDMAGPSYPWQAPDDFPAAASPYDDDTEKPASPRRVHTPAPVGNLQTLPEDETLSTVDSLDSLTEVDEDTDDDSGGKKNPVLKTNLPPPSTPSSTSRSTDTPDTGASARAIDPMTSNSFVPDDTPATESPAATEWTWRAPWQAPSRVKFPKPAPVVPVVPGVTGPAFPGLNGRKKAAAAPPAPPSDSFVPVALKAEDSSPSSVAESVSVAGYLSVPDKYTDKRASRGGSVAGSVSGSVAGSISSAPAGDGGYRYHR